ncbi:hypothetical protein GOODEAATRI_011306 [Goodea atripinnis]|uniref:Small nuclear ribonucleoprotein G n=3 Tax=Goodeidae TaxID=28758 RepID=A0ABV0NTP3_9TELE
MFDCFYTAFCSNLVLLPLLASVPSWPHGGAVGAVTTLNFWSPIARFPSAALSNEQVARRLSGTKDKMSKAHPPELKKFMDKKLSLKLNGGRHVQGILRGFDPFMNLVMDDCLEMGPGGQQNTVGMVVIRGNSIIMLEALERV